MDNTFKKGSEWRKWDLHIHTPESHLNNGFENNWDKYVQNLFKKAIEYEIWAVGITDYFTIEGYKKLKKEYLENENKLLELFNSDEIKIIKQILIFPNIEFRITNMTNGNKINFHVLFSDKVSIEDIESHFLHNLNFVYSGEPQNQDYKERLKIDTLEELGKKLKLEHEKFKNEGNDLFIGMMNASVSDSDISEELNKGNRFYQKYLIGIPSDEDLSSITWDGQGHQFRKILIQKADFLMSSNFKTRNWALGKSGNEEMQKKEFKSLKPCLWGSDAHSFDKLFVPDKSRYTWIKSDLTFEGLRQTIYEPEDRVFIGTNPPLIDRVKENSTKYISSLKINRNSKTNFNEIWFDKTNIEFNPGLVAIIGNKGKGKSAIADILGMLGDTKNHKHFSFLSDKKFRNKRDKKAEKFDAELQWASGEIKTTSLDYIPDQSSYEKIKYIPQDFLEILCNEENEELDSEIKNVVFSHVPEEDREGKEDLNKLIEFKCSSINKSIENNIMNLKELNKEIIGLEIKNQEEYIRNINSKLNIKRKELEIHNESKPKKINKPKRKKEIDSKLKSLNKQKEELIKKIDLLKKQKKEENIIKTNLTNAKTNIENFKKSFDEFSEKVQKELNKSMININEVISLTINTEKISNLINEKNKIIHELDSELDKENKNSLYSKFEKIELEIKKITENLDNANKDFELYIKKLGEWEDKLAELKGIDKYSDKKDSIKYYENSIKYIKNQLKKDIEIKSKERIDIVKTIYNEKKKILEYYEELYIPIEKFVKKYKLEESEYKVQFSVSLEAENFTNLFFDFIDKGKKGTFNGNFEGNKKITEIFEIVDFNEEEQVIKFLEKITLSLNEDLREECKNEKREPHSQIRKDKIEKFYEFIFSLEYLKPKYELKLGNTILSKLSPGEKGALLLIFYLLIDKNDIPLIIDQPEENLDNQTVFEIVAKFIKQAKTRRQIIVVTHNPNLAVICDAEQIIYADIDKKNQFKVTYNSGSIENPEINKKIVKILEGTLPAFNTRNDKYSITKRLN